MAVTTALFGATLVVMGCSDDTEASGGDLPGDFGGGAADEDAADASDAGDADAGADVRLTDTD